jgi:hypothetical protein
MQILNLAGRTLGMIVGIIGALLALIVTIFTVIGAHASELFNVANTSKSHGFLGTVAFVVGLVGALLSLPSAMVAAILMAIAGLLMLYVAGGWGIIPLIFLGLGAILVFLDRGGRKA